MEIPSFSGFKNEKHANDRHRNHERDIKCDRSQPKTVFEARSRMKQDEIKPKRINKLADEAHKYDKTGPANRGNYETEFSLRDKMTFLRFE